MLKYINLIFVLMIFSCGGNDHGPEMFSGVGGGYIVPTTGGNSSIGGGSSCAQQQIPLKVVPPDILIIQDRSGSMADDNNDKTCAGGCGVNSKWTQVITAIESVVSKTQTSVNWGLFYFGSGTSSCGVNTDPAVSIALNSSNAIQGSLSLTKTSGGTPTTATINNAVLYMDTLTDSNPKYLLLAIDGQPNCLNSSTNNPDDTGAINAVVAAKAAGYNTFIIGIGNVAAANATLNSMAQAGGEAQVGAATSYYAVSDTASLENALTKIVGMIGSCEISLENVPSGLWSIAIFVKDSSGNVIQIENNQTNGWNYTDTTKSSITLFGTTCDNVKSGIYSDLNFVYTCSGQIINPPG